MLRLSRKVLCLDWDKRSLRLVVARVGKARTVLEDAHSHRLPAGVEVDDPEALGDFIRSMLRRHGLRHRAVVVDVPRERAVINRLRLPPTPAREVAAAVRFQAMKELPFPLDTAAIDYVITDTDEQGLAREVLLAAVTTETLGRVRQTCEAAGLTPARIGLRPYANLISAQVTGGAREQRLLFLDVGPGASEIDVFRGGALGFSRSANVNVPLPAAGPAPPDDSRTISIAELSDLARGDEAVEAAINELVVETTRTLQAYRATEPDAVLDEIVVAGGTGLETQLAERLHRRLSLPVRLFDPTGPLNVAADEAPKLRSFSAALGLAWGLGREGALALDFLNPKRPVSARETLQRRARVAVLAAVLVLLAIGGVLGRQYAVLSRQLRELQAANGKLLTQAEQAAKTLNRVDEVREWAAEAVWPDELLNVVDHAFEPGARPGEKMALREIVLDTTGRTPGILLAGVYHTEWQVPTDFVNALNNLTVDGERLYEATQETWTRVEGRRYHGLVDIRISLRKLQQFRDQAAARAQARRDLLRDLGRVPTGS